MDLIMFIHQDSEKVGIALKKIIHQNFNESQIQTLCTFSTFKEKFKQRHNNNNGIFILLADCKNRLIELILLIDLMEDKRIVLILPDDSHVFNIKGSSVFFQDISLL